jgi:polyferredoxin
VSFRRTFMNDLRRQVATETESPPVWRLRFYAAGLSILFGVFGVVLVLPMARGVVSWAALPGALLLAVGGVFGVAVQRSAQIRVSRRRGWWAAVCTLAGLVEVGIVLALT